MRRAIPRRRPNWTPRSGHPFTQDEDRELCTMVRCGLSSEFYQQALPHRHFGEILDRRLQLIETGQLQRARAI